MTKVVGRGSRRRADRGACGECLHLPLGVATNPRGRCIKTTTTKTAELRTRRFIQRRRCHSGGVDDSQRRLRLSYEGSSVPRTENQRTLSQCCPWVLGGDPWPSRQLHQLEAASASAPFRITGTAPQVRVPDMCKERMQREAGHSSRAGLRRRAPSPVLLGTPLHYGPPSRVTMLTSQPPFEGAWQMPTLTSYLRGLLPF